MADRTGVLLIDTVTPGDAIFQIECFDDPSGIEVIALRGKHPNIEMFDSFLISEQEAIEASIALLYRYAPKALESWVVDALDDDDEVEIQSRKGHLTTIEAQPTPEFTEQ